MGLEGMASDQETVCAEHAQAIRLIVSIHFNVKGDTMSKISSINIGISEKDRKKVAVGLERMLADTYTLYLKTHNFHWNVTGPMFQTLHLMFMTQYNEIWMAVDLVAERIRALGYPAPGSYKEFAALTSIKDSDGKVSAKEMIKQLVEGQEAVVRTAREVLPIAEKAGDQPTVDLLSTRMEVHEKNAWMLRSLLEE
jgi:starvation-inducible DNA-binding protein